MKFKRAYSKEVEKNFVLAIALILLVLTFITLQKILTLIIFSFMLSYFLFPVYRYYKKKCGNESLSSLLTLLTVTAFVFLPLALLSYFLILNLIKLLVQYKIYIENPEILNNVLADFFENFANSSVLSSVNFSEIFSTFVIYISDLATNFFSSIPINMLYFFIVLFLTYYVLKYNEEIMISIRNYVPLSSRKQQEILDNLKISMSVIFRGYFLTGVIQTFVAFIGYLVFGAPNVLLLTFLTFLLSLIPYLGTPIIWVPVAFYMVLVGDVFNGVALFLYGVFIISMIDNFVRPILMSNKETISPPLVFVGFVGGILAFGVSGLFLGPLIISVTIIFFKYVNEYYGIN